MKTLAPEKSPIFLTVHEVGEPEQFIEIYAKAPNRMIYAEGYRFDTAGNYIGDAGYEDGEWGKQLFWSMYRLHFGDFAGLTSKWFFFVLGVMLTMLCVSGMEIWLSKKAHPPLASRLWYAVVWGSVSALALTAAVDMFFAGSLIAVFWCLMLVNTAVTVAVKSLTKPLWLMISGLSVLVLLITYVAVHQGAAFSVASLQLNIPMGVYVAWSLYRANVLIKRAKRACVHNNDLSPSAISRDTQSSSVNA